MYTYIHMYIQQPVAPVQLFYNCVCCVQVETASSASSFSYEAGMDVWGEIIGAAAVQKPAEQQLPNGAVRIHVGVFKAFLNSAQGVGSTRFGVFFGGFWKKEKNTPLYRCNHFVMGGHLQKLLNSQSVKDAAGQSRQVLGVGMVELSPDPVRCDVPSTALLEALKSIAGF